MNIRSSILFGLMLSASAAAAETRQFANIIYDIPTGWVENGSEGNRVELRYDRDDDGCEYCTLWIDPGSPKNGPLDIWLKGEAQPGRDVIVLSEQEKRGDTIRDFPVITLLRQVEDDGSGRIQAFFAIDLPTRNELVVFQGNAADQDSFERSLATVNGDVLAFLDALKFVSDGADPLLGPAEPGNLSGPWFGSAIRNRYNGLSGTLDLVVDRKMMTFYSDGRFYDGISPTGAAALDVPSLVAAGDMALGNYTVTSGDIELNYANGTESHMRQLNDTAIGAGRVTMAPAAFPPDGYRFSGSIHSVSYTAFGAGVSGGVGGEHTQIFNKDGTFTDSSFTSVSGSFDTGGGFAGGSGTPETTGHYDVAGGRIVLTPPEGEPLETWIILEGGDSAIIGGEPVSAMDRK